MLILEVQQKCTKPRVVISVYRPPQGNVSDCLNTIKAAIKSIGPDVEICILGDFNIDYGDKTSTAKKELRALEREYNLIQCIKTPTRVTGTTNTLLDHMYTNLKNISCTGIVQTYLSDHFPTFLIIKKEAVVIERVSFTFRSMKEYSEEALKLKLEEHDWSYYYTINNPQECWE